MNDLQLLRFPFGTLFETAFLIPATLELRYDCVNAFVYLDAVAHSPQAKSIETIARYVLIVFHWQSLLLLANS